MLILLWALTLCQHRDQFFQIQICAPLKFHLCHDSSPDLNFEKLWFVICGLYDGLWPRNNSKEARLHLRQQVSPAWEAARVSGTKSGQTAGFSWSIKPTSAHFNCFGCFVNFSLYEISFHGFGKECNFFDMHRALYARQAVNLKCTMRSGRARWFGMTWWENVCEGSCVDSFWDDNLQNRETGNLLQFAAIHCNSLQFIGRDSLTVRFTALTGGYDDN